MSIHAFFLFLFGQNSAFGHFFKDIKKKVIMDSEEQDGRLWMYTNAQCLMGIESHAIFDQSTLRFST